MKTDEAKGPGLLFSWQGKVGRWWGALACLALSALVHLVLLLLFVSKPATGTVEEHVGGELEIISVSTPLGRELLATMEHRDLSFFSPEPEALPETPFTAAPVPEYLAHRLRALESPPEREERALPTVSEWGRVYFPEQGAAMAAPGAPAEPSHLTPPVQVSGPLAQRALRHLPVPEESAWLRALAGEVVRARVEVDAEGRVRGLLLDATPNSEIDPGLQAFLRSLRFAPQPGQTRLSGWIQIN
ncbi:MAG: hypothetical protein AAF555_01350 [Verrucomicrobiota bacterium]